MPAGTVELRKMLTTLLLTTFAAQAPPTGIEGLLAALRERTAARRLAAKEAWKEHGEVIRKDHDEARWDALVELGPEIQEPVLADLQATLSAGADEEQLYSLLILLQDTMNAAGANQLTALVPELPTGLRGKALQAAIERGGGEAIQLAEQKLQTGEPLEKQGALLALAMYGPIERGANYVQQGLDAGIESEDMGDVLMQLALREFPSDLQLPVILFEQPQSEWEAGLLAICGRSPQAASEAYLLTRVVNVHTAMETRSNVLPLLEAAAAQFRWRETERQLSQFLKERAVDNLADPIAWTLHRLGDKDGSKFLLADPLAAVKRAPRSHRARFRLARLYVELGEFSTAYREFRTGIKITEGTPHFNNIRSEEWFYAARAAAGSRHLRDAADWLEAARMSPSELSPYRSLPEFEPLLDRQPFKRIFGLD